MSDKQPVYVIISNDIIESIKNGELKPGDMIPTEKEFMLKYNVSRITIRNAMNILASSGYITRVAGRGTFISDRDEVTRGGKKVIGLVLCNIGASYGLEILTSLERIASASGYMVIFKNAVNDVARETRAIEELVEAKVDGIIIQPVHGESFNPAIMKLSMEGFPLVVIDRKLKGLSVSFVGSNNKAAAKTATATLFKNGHNDIAFISTEPKNSTTLEERIEGFNQAYILYQKVNSSNNFLLTIRTPKADVDNEIFNEDVNDVMNYLLKNPQITAIFSAEYMVAKIVYTAICKLGKRIPEDYSLITFDYGESITCENIAYIRQNQESIAKEAFKQVIKLKDGESEIKDIVLDAQIQKGNSIKNIYKS